jgi:hypothetical protein
VSEESFSRCTVKKKKKNFGFVYPIKRSSTRGGKRRGRKKEKRI